MRFGSVAGKYTEPYRGPLNSFPPRKDGIEILTAGFESVSSLLYTLLPFSKRLAVVTSRHTRQSSELKVLSELSRDPVVLQR